MVLFRGVNVGGHRKLPMATLRERLTANGYDKPRTYIQSGNLVVGTSKDAGAILSDIGALIEQNFGFRPDMLILSQDQFERTVAACPFTGDAYDPSRVFVWFHVNTQVEFDGVIPENDEHAKLVVGQDAHYLHAPNGLSKSVLAEQMSRRIGKQTTCRNIRTCNKIRELIGE